MSTNEHGRASLLLELLNLERPVSSILAQLREFGWDSEPLVRLNCSHIENVLNRYLTGLVHPSEVEAWAEVIEVRDDIQVDPAVKQVVHELANPVLTRPLSSTLALEWLNRLNIQTNNER